MSGSDNVERLNPEELLLSEQDIMDMLGLEAVEGTDPIQYQMVNVYYQDGERYTNTVNSMTDTTMGTVTMLAEDRINSMLYLLGPEHPAVQQFIFNQESTDTPVGLGTEGFPYTLEHVDPSLRHLINPDILYVSEDEPGQPLGTFNLTPEKRQALNVMLLFGDQHRIREIVDNNDIPFQDGAAALSWAACSDIFNSDGSRTDFTQILSAETPEEAMILFSSLANDEDGRGSFVNDETEALMMMAYNTTAETVASRNALLIGSAPYSHFVPLDSDVLNGFDTDTTILDREDVIRRMSNSPAFSEMVLQGIDGTNGAAGELQSMEMANLLDNLATDAPEDFSAFLDIEEVTDYLSDEGRFSVAQMETFFGTLTDVNQQADFLDTIYNPDGEQRPGYDIIVLELQDTVEAARADAAASALQDNSTASYMDADWIPNGQPSQLESQQFNDAQAVLDAMIADQEGLAEQVFEEFTPEAFDAFVANLPPEQWADAAAAFDGSEFDMPDTNVVVMQGDEYVEIPATEFNPDTDVLVVPTEDGLYFEPVDGSITLADYPTDINFTQITENIQTREDIPSIIDSLVNINPEDYETADAFEDAVDELIDQLPTDSPVFADVVTQFDMDRISTNAALNDFATLTDLQEAFSDIGEFEGLVDSFTEFDFSSVEQATETIENSDIDPNSPEFVAASEVVGQLTALAEHLESQEDFNSFLNSLPPEQLADAIATFENDPFSGFDSDNLPDMMVTIMNEDETYTQIDAVDYDAAIHGDMYVVGDDGQYVTAADDTTIGDVIVSADQHQGVLDAMILQDQQAVAGYVDVLGNPDATQEQIDDALAGLESYSDIEGADALLTQTDIQAVIDNDAIDIQDLQQFGDIMANTAFEAPESETEEVSVADMVDEHVETVIQGDLGTLAAWSTNLQNYREVTTVTFPDVMRDDEGNPLRDDSGNLMYEDGGLPVFDDKGNLTGYEVITIDLTSEATADEAVAAGDAMSPEQAREYINARIDEINSFDQYDLDIEPIGTLMAETVTQEEMVENVAVAEQQGAFTTDDVSGEVESAYDVVDDPDQAGVTEEEFDAVEAAQEGDSSALEDLIQDTTEDELSEEELEAAADAAMEEFEEDVTVTEDIDTFVETAEDDSDFGETLEENDISFGVENPFPEEIESRGEYVVVQENLGDEFNAVTYLTNDGITIHVEHTTELNSVVVEVVGANGRGSHFVMTVEDGEVVDYAAMAEAIALGDLSGTNNGIITDFDMMSTDIGTRLYDVTPANVEWGVTHNTPLYHATQYESGIVSYRDESYTTSVNTTSENVVYQANGQDHIVVNDAPGNITIFDPATGETVSAVYAPGGQIRFESVGADGIGYQTYIDVPEGMTVTQDMLMEASVLALDGTVNPIENFEGWSVVDTTGPENLAHATMSADGSFLTYIDSNNIEQAMLVMDQDDINLISSYGQESFEALQANIGEVAFANLASDNNFVLATQQAGNLDNLLEVLIDPETMDGQELQAFLLSLPADLHFDLVNDPAFLTQIADNPDYLAALTDPEYLEFGQDGNIIPEHLAAVAHYGEMLDTLADQGVDVTAARENLQELVNYAGLGVDDYGVDVTDGIDQHEMAAIVSELSDLDVCLTTDGAEMEIQNSQGQHADIIAGIADVWATADLTGVDAQNVTQTANISGEEQTTEQAATV